MYHLQFSYRYHPLKFIKPATTSRDTLTEKPSWIIRISAKDEAGKNLVGYGEVSIIEGLSIESSAQISQELSEIAAKPDRLLSANYDQLPALKFAIETALMDAQSAQHCLFDTPFTRREKAININGLVWMGPIDDMRKQLSEKIAAGFDCVKLKIGALDWEKERSLIEALRETYSKDEIMIRVDANGAFTNRNPHKKLEELAQLDVHSIEQVVAAGNWDLHKELCEHGAIPCALDEELIGTFERSEQEKMLDYIRPQFIILKPSLLGGLAASDQWISVAEERKIGWWATSALESNLGLNAIAQWCSSKENPIHQGLGTGSLYHNNFHSPLVVSGGQLHYGNDNWANFEELWPDA